MMMMLDRSGLFGFCIAGVKTFAGIGLDLHSAVCGIMEDENLGKSRRAFYFQPINYLSLFRSFAYVSAGCLGWEEG